MSGEGKNKSNVNGNKKGEHAEVHSPKPKNKNPAKRDSTQVKGEEQTKPSHKQVQENKLAPGHNIGETEKADSDQKDEHEDMDTGNSSGNEKEDTEPVQDDTNTKKHNKGPKRPNHEEHEHSSAHGRNVKRTNPQPCDDTSHGTGSRDSSGGVQQQAMLQMQRAAEASKQMLYGVYGNVVSILEEYEARTQKTKVARSKIALPDQSKKSVDDVQSIVQTQLLLFETQQRACPKDISQSVNKELRKKTLHWAAVREEKKMPMNETDKYICQLYEVLVKGKTKHDFLDKPREEVSAETIRENVQHIFKGKHDAQEIDQKFKHDDKKKATSPETRQSELDDAYKIGAKRMSEARKDLKTVLFCDIKEFLADGLEGSLQ